MKESNRPDLFTPIVFSQWYLWEDRQNVPGNDLPGVYLVAEFDHRQDQQNADPLDQHILYIGQTGGRLGKTGNRVLIKRWHEFEHSAKTGKRAHAGGRNCFCKSLPKQWDAVCVAALQFPYDSSEDLATVLQHEGLDPKVATIALVSRRLGPWFIDVEKKLLSGFERQYGKLPPCNKRDY